MNFCSNCGQSISGETKFCSNCGNATQAQHSATALAAPPAPAPPVPPVPIYAQQPNLLQTLSSKLKTDATIWMAVGIFQVLAGIVNLFIGIYLFVDWEDGTTNCITGGFLLLVGIVNLINSSKQRKYAQTVLSNPIGIVKKFEPVGPLVGSLIYNLFLGGVVGIIGTIYGFTVRSFVLQNVMQFNQMESEFAAGTQR